jgi:hypothetical protein
MMSLPSERDSVLLVDANTVPTLPVASQGLKTIARYGNQVIEPLGAVKHRELATHDRPQLLWDSARCLAISLGP